SARYGSATTLRPGRRSTGRGVVLAPSIVRATASDAAARLSTTASTGTKVRSGATTGTSRRRIATSGSAASGGTIGNTGTGGAAASALPFVSLPSLKSRIAVCRSSGQSAAALASAVATSVSPGSAAATSAGDGSAAVGRAPAAAGAAS